MVGYGTIIQIILFVNFSLVINVIKFVCSKLLNEIQRGKQL